MPDIVIQQRRIANPAFRAKLRRYSTRFFACRCSKTCELASRAPDRFLDVRTEFTISAPNGPRVTPSAVQNQPVSRWDSRSDFSLNAPVGRCCPVLVPSAFGHPSSIQAINRRLPYRLLYDLSATLGASVDLA